MNKKVVSTMIILSWIFLLALSIVKLFFGEWFAIVITNENLIAVGRFIDSHWYLEKLCYCFCSFLTYSLYLSAVTRKWLLKWWQYIALAVFVVALDYVKVWQPLLGMSLDVIVMILVPYLLKADYKDVAIIFTAHYCSQAISLYIRSLPLLLVDVNFLTQFILILDQYIWLLLYYLYANKYRKENNDMGRISPPLYGTSKFYAKKKAKAEKKIEKLKAVIAECDARLASFVKKDETK